VLLSCLFVPSIAKFARHLISILFYYRKGIPDYFRVCFQFGSVGVAESQYLYALFYITSTISAKSSFCVTNANSMFCSARTMFGREK
jgi:hypothetical protein